MASIARTTLPRSLLRISRSTPIAAGLIPRARGLPSLPTPRYAHTGSKMAATQKQQDAPSLDEKLSALNGFLDTHKFVLLTCRAPDGSLHARTMAIAEKTKDMKIRFIYDRDSYKETEIDNDAHVNVAADASEKNDGWVSIAGKARRVTDNSEVARLYNPTIKAWFGDKGDGVHTGGPEDPRMAILEVRPDEIRHYHQQRSSIGVLGEVLAATVTGNTASPGSIRTITNEELATVA